ncbi:hypothetical protein N9301_03835 [Paracoccaceae bacterium]|nr:hypothetical protein [Paracoccaceae bacterium]
MEDAVVLERISSLKGRSGYEEKKAMKLGFSSIYEYIEDKIKNENNPLILKIKYLTKSLNPL